MKNKIRKVGQLIAKMIPIIPHLISTSSEGDLLQCSVIVLCDSYTMLCHWWMLLVTLGDTKTLVKPAWVCL